MVSNGMKAAGYDYVNVDDCWMASNRDSAGNLVAGPHPLPGRDQAGGRLRAQPGPQARHLRGRRHRPRAPTCPGSYGHEAQDAATFAAWGVDYVKYDRCNIPYGDFPGETQQQVQQTLYTRMSDALRATGRPIVFSMANPDPGRRSMGVGESDRQPVADHAPTSRTTSDRCWATSRPPSSSRADARPGAWNDPDLLQIGNGGSSPLEYRTEFSLWAEMAAPLIASTNITTLSPSALAIYENRNVIAVDQDPLGAQGVPISSAGGLWVLTKPLQNGDRAVVLFNSTNTAAADRHDRHGGRTADRAGLPPAGSVERSR